MISSGRFAALVALALGLAVPAARADVVVNFGDVGYPGGAFDPNEGFPPGQAPGVGSYNNGWDLPGGFTSSGVFFSNAYDPSNSGAWQGWAYSNVNDPTKALAPGDADFNHQFAAITGTAPLGGLNYGIDFDGHTSGNGTISDGAPSSFINLAPGRSPVSMLVTNTTYACLSMVFGDGFGKKFTTGDFFELQIYGYKGPDGTGGMVNGGNPVNFLLANYTSSSSLPISDWELVNLTPLAGAVSLGFGFVSSDFGPNGYNTPLYFAMDDLTLSTSAVPEPSSVMLASVGLGLAGLSAARRRRPAAAR